MDILIKILQFILSFSLLVIIHEFGHFLFARLFKTRVEKFYLFFNPWFSLFKFKKGGTEYGIGWIPFGGYVKIAGMIDESILPAIVLAVIASALLTPVLLKLSISRGPELA